MKTKETPVAVTRYVTREVRKYWSKWERKASKARGALVKFSEVHLVADDAGLHWYLKMSSVGLAVPGPIPTPYNWELFAGAITRGMRPGHSVVVTKR